MARTLLFTADRFEMIYEGLLASQRGFEAPIETRIVGKILDKLEENEHVEMRLVEGGRATHRVVEDKSPLITLSDEEWKLLVEAVKKVPWGARAAKKATDAVDWLEKLESS